MMGLFGELFGACLRVCEEGESVRKHEVFPWSASKMYHLQFLSWNLKLWCIFAIYLFIFYLPILWFSGAGAGSEVYRCGDVPLIKTYYFVGRGCMSEGLHLKVLVWGVLSC